MSLSRQLALPFPYEPDFRPLDFLEAGSNSVALAWLGCTDAWPGGRLFLWGETGCGKTHLLHRWAHDAGALRRAGQTIRARPDAPLQPDGSSALAIDDADLAEEEPLLHLLNAAAEHGSPTLLTARLPPSRWAIRLPDLASRLRAMTAIEIGPPEDTLLKALLMRLLAERQLAAPPAVQDWLLVRLPRTQAAVREAAARLDRASLAAGTKITRATASWVLESLGMAATLAGDDPMTDDFVTDEFSGSLAASGSSALPGLM